MFICSPFRFSPRCQAKALLLVPLLASKSSPSVISCSPRDSVAKFVVLYTTIAALSPVVLGTSCNVLQMLSSTVVRQGNIPMQKTGAPSMDGLRTPSPRQGLPCCVTCCAMMSARPGSCACFVFRCRTEFWSRASLVYLEAQPAIGQGRGMGASSRQRLKEKPSTSSCGILTSGTTMYTTAVLIRCPSIHVPTRVATDLKRA